MPTLEPLIKQLTVARSLADGNALTIEGRINQEESQIALDDANATLAELDSRDVELRGYIAKAEVYLQLGDATQEESIKRFNEELKENDALRDQAQNAINDVNKAKEQAAVA